MNLRHQAGPKATESRGFATSEGVGAFHALASPSGEHRHNRQPTSACCPGRRGQPLTTPQCQLLSPLARRRTSIARLGSKRAVALLAARAGGWGGLPTAHLLAAWCAVEGTPRPREGVETLKPARKERFSTSQRSGQWQAAGCSFWITFPRAACSKHSARWMGGWCGRTYPKTVGGLPPAFFGNLAGDVVQENSGAGKP